ncbi:MAG: hypothetical protein IKM54_05495, partial [Butyricicoccus sp.]|nr:hypothetical protein [Butyricicoccus sp.]
SGELMHTVLAAVRAQDGLPAHIRADFETYSFAERVRWTAQGSLAFDAALYFAPEGTDGQRTVIYHPDSGSLEIG